MVRSSFVCLLNIFASNAKAQDWKLIESGVGAYRFR
jgi:hypothetical protein